MASNVEAKVTIFEPTAGNYIVRTSDSALAVKLLPLLTGAKTLTIITPTDMRVVEVGAQAPEPEVVAEAPTPKASKPAPPIVEPDGDAPAQPEDIQEAWMKQIPKDSELAEGGAETAGTGRRRRAERPEPVVDSGGVACRRCGGAGANCPVCAGTGVSRVPTSRRKL